MRTLVGLFETRQNGERAAEQLRAAGLQPEIIGSPEGAADALQDAATTDDKSDATVPATAATLGGLAGLGVGALPASLIGMLVGKGLSERTADEYQQQVAAGGVAIVVEAEEIHPAAQAETILRAAGAVHVHTGERATG